MSLLAFLLSSQTPTEKQEPIPNDINFKPELDEKKKSYWWVILLLLALIFLVGKNTKLFSKKIGVASEPTVTQQVVVAPAPSLTLEEILAEGTSTFLSVEKYSVLLSSCNDGKGDERACRFLDEYHERNNMNNFNYDPIVPGQGGNVSRLLFDFFKRIGVRRISDVYALGEKGVLGKMKKNDPKTKLLPEIKELLKDANYSVATWEGKIPEPHNVRLNDLEANFSIQGELYDVLIKAVRARGLTEDLDGVYDLGKLEGEKTFPKEWLRKIKKLLKEYGYPIW